MNESSAASPAEPSSPNTPAAPPTYRGHAGIGVVVAIVSQAITLLIASVAPHFAPNPSDGAWLPVIILAVFGLVQWIYIVPIGIALHYLDRPRTAFGLWITAGVLFLINAGCWGLVAMN